MNSIVYVRIGNKMVELGAAINELQNVANNGRWNECLFNSELGLANDLYYKVADRGIVVELPPEEWPPSDEEEQAMYMTELLDDMYIQEEQAYLDAWQQEACWPLIDGH